MLGRLSDYLKYRLERLLLRGMYTRLLVMAGVVGVTSVLGGVLVEAGGERFDSHADAIWWAFLRLTDPGYLGDDQGAARRTISAVLTVLGYVLFMGSLIAVMTQWLNHTIRDLERGSTRIVRNDHVVILGLTSRTHTIAREMFTTAEGRVRRFLALHDVKKLHMVLMVEGLGPSHREELRTYLGPLWREGQIVMRSGSPLHIEHLRRVDYLHAAAILLPSEDVGGDEALADASTIKTLRSIDANSASLDEAELPLVVTEIFDVAHVPVARRAYRGPLEVISTDRMIGRLLALTTLQPGLSRVFDEMLVYGEGSEIHIQEPGVLVGRTYAELPAYFPKAIVLGWVTRCGDEYVPHLCAKSDDVVEADDMLVLLSEDHEASVPLRTPTDEDDPVERQDMSAPPSAPHLKILVIGWSDRVPDLVSELAAHHGARFEVTIVSSVPVDTRAELLAEHDQGAALVHNVLGDATKAHVLVEQLELGFDRVVLVASDWLATGAQSDARTILSYLLVREVLDKAKARARVVVELMDHDNKKLVGGPGVDVVISPRIIGRVLAHVTLRRELRCVYDEMFDADGPVIALRSPAAYGIPSGQHTFGALEMTVRGKDVLLGIFERRAKLNPSKEEDFTISGSTQLLVLRRR